MFHIAAVWVPEEDRNDLTTAMHTLKHSISIVTVAMASTVQFHLSIATYRSQCFLYDLSTKHATIPATDFIMDLVMDYLQSHAPRGGPSEKKYGALLSVTLGVDPIHTSDCPERCSIQADTPIWTRFYWIEKASDCILRAIHYLTNATIAREGSVDGGERSPLASPVRVDTTDV